MYKVVVGSRSYGIELPKSDTDIFLLDPLVDRYEKHYADGVDHHNAPLAYFKTLFTADNPPWYFTQLICPQTALEPSATATYIEDHREEIAGARKSAIYDVLLNRGNGLRFCAEDLYARGYTKRAAYAICLYSILSNWADGMTFEEAHRPAGELHDFLMGVRNQALAAAEVVERVEGGRKKAIEAEAFFAEIRADTPIRELLQIAESEVSDNA